MLQHRSKVRQCKQIKNDAKAWHVQTHFHNELEICEITKEKPLTLLMHSHLKSWDFLNKMFDFKLDQHLGYQTLYELNFLVLIIGKSWKGL
jgi:hypothetical protein